MIYISQKSKKILSRSMLEKTGLLWYILYEGGEYEF